MDYRAYVANPSASTYGTFRSSANTAASDSAVSTLVSDLNSVNSDSSLPVAQGLAQNVKSIQSSLPLPAVSMKVFQHLTQECTDVMSSHMSLDARKCV